MNSADRLRAIIAERREWEAFGWGPILGVWALVLGSRMVLELWLGPRADLGTGAFFLILGVQGLLVWAPGADQGTKQVTMHGFWALVAACCWFLGSWAPAFGWFPALGGAVLELLFLAGGLAIVGLLKNRPSLVWAGGALACCSVLVGTFPILWAWRPLAVALAFGIPAVLTTIKDQASRPNSQK